MNCYGQVTIGEHFLWIYFEFYHLKENYVIVSKSHVIVTKFWKNSRMSEVFILNT